MPALIRNGGKLWGADGAEDDTLAVIPDSSYAGVYATVIEDVKRNGPLDPATIGTVPERRPHGAGRGGVRLAQQDLRDPRRRHRHRRQPGRRGPARPRRRGRRHLARLPDQGHPGPRLGEARRHPGPRRADPGDLLARRVPRPRRRADQEGQRLPARARHDRPGNPGSSRPSWPRRTRSSACGRGSTRSP